MKNFTVVMIVLLLLQISCDNINDSGSLYDLSNSSYSGSSGGFTGVSLTGDTYTEFEENPFIYVAEQPVSTFSVDADGASYANIRRFIQQDNQLPPKGAVRTEEMINYFSLDYEYGSNSHPISLNGEVSSCPWNSANKLIRIGIKGKPIPPAEMPSSNFVFLIDVSGSMAGDDKLSLLKSGFILFVDELNENDRVAIVTYAGYSAVALASTAGNEKQKIKNAINSLGAGGSTAGAEGIISAYEIAQSNFISGGNNRVILGTDGDFNVGISSQEELITLIEDKRELGIFLTVLGVGRGNLNDAALEQIANNGNGTYEYIDNLDQIKKVFIYDFGKFYTVAKDVKVQVDFNPNTVEAYRLIGYENRLLAAEDFEDDGKDAGEIGSDQNITALYEIIPKNNTNYRSVPTFTIDFRYKAPDSDISVPLRLEIFDDGKSFNESSGFMRFTASIASLSMLITDSQYKGTSSFEDVLVWLKNTSLRDDHGFKQELEGIVEEAMAL
jgi:Ca-activated chloride channel homolog